VVTEKKQQLSILTGKGKEKSLSGKKGKNTLHHISDEKQTNISVNRSPLGTGRNQLCIRRKKWVAVKREELVEQRKRREGRSSIVENMTNY